MWSILSEEHDFHATALSELRYHVARKGSRMLLHRLLARTTGLLLAILFCLVAAPAKADGSLTGFTPVRWESQYRLAQEAKKSEEKVKRLLSIAMSMDPGADKAEWLDIASRFDKRAAMLELNASFEKKLEYSLGANAAQLKLVAKVIRQVVTATPPKADPKQKEYHFVEVAYLAKAKQTAYIKAVRAKLDELSRDAVRTKTHPGSSGTAIKTDGDTVIWDLSSKSADYVTKMVGVARDVGKQHGVKW